MMKFISENLVTGKKMCDPDDKNKGNRNVRV